MIEENRKEFEKANIIQWHEAGYLGQGISVAVAENKTHTDEQIEYNHDFIQWIFPTIKTERSVEYSLCLLLPQIRTHQAATRDSA